MFLLWSRRPVFQVSRWRRALIGGLALALAASGGCRGGWGSGRGPSAAALPASCPVLEVSVALIQARAGAGGPGAAGTKVPARPATLDRGAFEPLAVDPVSGRLLAPAGWKPPGRLKAVVLRREEVLGVGLPPLARPVARFPCLLTLGPGGGRGRPSLWLLGVGREGTVTLGCGGRRFLLEPGETWARTWCLDRASGGAVREIEPGARWRPEIEAAFQAGYELVRVDVTNLGRWGVGAAGEGLKPAAAAPVGGDWGC